MVCACTGVPVQIQNECTLRFLFQDTTKKPLNECSPNQIQFHFWFGCPRIYLIYVLVLFPGCLQIHVEYQNALLGMLRWRMELFTFTLEHNRAWCKRLSSNISGYLRAVTNNVNLNGNVTWPFLAPSPNPQTLKVDCCIRWRWEWIFFTFSVSYYVERLLFEKEKIYDYDHESQSKLNGDFENLVDSNFERIMRKLPAAMHFLKVGSTREAHFVSLAVLSVNDRLKTSSFSMPSFVWKFWKYNHI